MTILGQVHDRSRFRPKFASSKEIEELSANFVMVKSSDESEFTGDEFGPDGGYVPRILFFDDAGQHMKDIVQREDKYKASEASIYSLNDFYSMTLI